MISSRYSTALGTACLLPPSPLLRFVSKERGYWCSHWQKGDEEISDDKRVRCMESKRHCMFFYSYCKKMPLLAPLPQELQQVTEWQCCWGWGKGIKQESSDSLSRLEAVFYHITNFIILVSLSSFLSRNLWYALLQHWTIEWAMYRAECPGSNFNITPGSFYRCITQNLLDFELFLETVTWAEIYLSVKLWSMVGWLFCGLSSWPLAPACLRQKAVVVTFVTGFPAVAINPSQLNLLAVLLWAVLGIVCSLCKLKEVNDRGNSDVDLFVWWVGTSVCQSPVIH